MSENEKLERLEADLLKAREKASTKPAEYREKAKVLRQLRPDDPSFQKVANRLETMAEEEKVNISKLDEIIQKLREIRQGSL